MKNIATIEKRNNSYRFIVSCGYDMTGKQIRKTMTWKPEPNMTAKQIEKEVQRQTTLFEKRCLKGQVLVENIRFAEFAEIWMKDRKNDLRLRTYARYESLLPRIRNPLQADLKRPLPSRQRFFHGFYSEVDSGKVKISEISRNFVKLFIAYFSENYGEIVLIYARIIMQDCNVLFMGQLI